MAILQPDQPVLTDEPVLKVENCLKSGSYCFRLRVIDNTGNVSQADERIVEVKR